MKTRYTAALITAGASLTTTVFIVLNKTIVTGITPLTYILWLPTIIFAFLLNITLQLTRFFPHLSLLENFSDTTAAIILASATICIWAFIAGLGGYIYEKNNTLPRPLRILISLLPAAIIILIGLSASVIY